MVVGTLKQNVIDALNLPFQEGTKIMLGDTNIAHMLSRHPDAYQKYGDKIQEILDIPDYVGMNPGDSSIEYVKEYQIDNEFVKVAVRISNNGVLFARSLYILNNNRVNNFINKGTLIPLV